MIEIIDVKKSYGGIKSLREVNLNVRQGEIHALLGENGAGKSTLMKIIAGAVIKDSGEIRLDGKEVNFKDTQAAKKSGIGIIYQEFSLVPALSVAENIFLHRLKGKAIINWKALYTEAEKRIEELGFKLDVKLPVSRLSVSQQQIVEIAKALVDDVKVLILDEPSTTLGPVEVHKLFATLRGLKEKGVAIIYISHHLDELFKLSDRITVLKDGVTVKTFITSETNKDELVHAMLGKSLNALFPHREPLRHEGNDTYTFENIHVLSKPDPVSFSVRAGEILGIGGLVGSGRTEVLRAIFGADSNPSKRMFRNKERITVRSPRQAVSAGIGMVPEDRKQQGGLIKISIRENICLANYKKVVGSLGFINKEKEKELVQGFVKKMDIRLASFNNALSSLSGGNQQKVVLAKWLNIDAGLLLIDEPTRGVDVGARSEIYRIIHELSEAGLAIIMVSSDWEELMGLSDRIMVMKNGAVQGELSRADFSQEKFLRLAIGAANG